jgi:phage-related minor tail protein
MLPEGVRKLIPGFADGVRNFSGGLAVVGERGPELFTPSTSGRVTRNQDMGNGGGVTNVNFTIVANDTTGFDQLLASRKGVIQQIISDAMLEKGKRSFA